MESLTAPVGLAVVGAGYRGAQDRGLSGWKPEVDLHGGPRELVAWCRAERVAT